MTSKAGFYGSDAKENRFRVPDLNGTRSQNEAYFVLVNKETGKREVWNEEFGSDKFVGSYDKGGEFEPNENWWGGAQSEEKEFFNSEKGQNLVNNHASTVALKGKLDEGKSVEQAQVETNELVKKNNAKVTDQQLTKARSSTTKADKNTRNSFPKMLFYPETLRKQTQDVIKFNMMKYEPKDLPKGLVFGERSSDVAGRTIGSVLLPIPGGISDSNQVGWNQENMDPVAIVKAELALKTILQGGKGFTDAVGDIANAVKGANRNAVGTLIAQAASGTGQQLLQRSTGSILNPNMELLFQGPQLRDFTFQFKLSPRSKTEAEKVIQIIRFFKQGMAPIRSQSRLFLKSPHTFKLQYLHQNDDHPGLNKIKECALQSCTVAYGEQQYSTYEDGILSSYNMQLSFKELEPVFNDEYTELDNNQDTTLGY